MALPHRPWQNRLAQMATAVPTAPQTEPPPPNPRPSRLSQGLAAFQHRNFRLFFTGQFVSVTGTWIHRLAQSWLVLTLTPSAFALGLVSALQFLPILLLGLAGGIVADRFPKRNLLVATQSAAAVQAAFLAALVWFGHVELWHVYVLALGLGTVNAFDMPSRQSFVVEMVGKEDLVNAVALNSAVFNAARLIGPALAGFILAAFGVAVCFAINSVSYLAVIAGLLLMRIERRERQRSRGGFSQLREGLDYVRRTPPVLMTIVLVGAVATFGMNSNVWVPLLAKKEFEVGGSGFGILFAALGLGSLIGALGLAFLGREPRRGVLLAGASAMGLFELVLALAGAIPLSLAAALIILPGIGLAMTTTTSMANSFVQSTVPDALRGRVMSVYMTVFAGTVPFGALLTGTTAKFFGTPASIAIGGLVTLIAAGWIAWYSGVLGHRVPRERPTAIPPVPRAERPPGSRSSASASGHD